MEKTRGVTGVFSGRILLGCTFSACAHLRERERRERELSLDSFHFGRHRGPNSKSLVTRITMDKRISQLIVFVMSERRGMRGGEKGKKNKRSSSCNCLYQ